MKDLRIEFGRSGRADAHARLWWAGLVLAIGLALAGLVTAARCSELAAARNAEARALRAEHDSLMAAASQQEQVPSEVVEAVNGAIRVLDYPSLALLDQLERHARPGIAIVSVELGAVRTNLRVIVQVANPADALDYLDSLRTEAGFRNAALTRQEAGNGGEGQGGGRFTFEVPQQDAVPRATARSSRGQEG